ncbi:MAG TPA: type IV secretory system conjugative DNA transfer family protein [Pseudolysinimonas sp.]|nr:type IV secretory system conjugative DNA transfer family protein [Pseudolysinimonas sp.]
MTSSDLIWQAMHWPSPLNPGHGLGLLRLLASDAERGPVIFEARAENGEVTHLFGTAAHQVREMSSLVTSSVPGVAFSADPDRHMPESIGQVTLSGSPLSLQFDRLHDTARAMLGALSAARFKDESLVLQIVLGRGRPPHSLPPRPADPTQPLASLLTRGVRQPTRQVAASLELKAGESGFRASIRVGVTAASPGRRRALVQGLLAALRTTQTPGIRIDLRRLRSADFDTLPSRGSLPLSSAEVLALIGWPIGDEQLPGMPDPHPKLLPLRARSIEKERVFATTTAPGKERPVGIDVKDALFHTVFLGPTGAGKSTALLNLIVADLEAGRSVVVIDPKSDLVRDVLARVPQPRYDDVVVLDPTQDAPVGLNPLGATDTPPELVADGLLAIFRDLYPNAFGPRTADVLHASLLTLAKTEDATLAWLPRMLTDPVLRQRITTPLDDPDLVEFWDQFDAMSDRQQTQHVGPVLSRLRQFLLRPSLRRVLDQATPRFQLQDLFTTPTVLLVPLNQGLLGRDATRLLGSLLVSRLWQLTLARATRPKDERPPVSIYIDEAQEFLRLGGDDLADALARSRSLGVAWHLAHQYRAQMPREMLSAIDANARSKVIFGLGIDDARAMAAMAPELSPEDFASQPPRAVYVHLIRDGHPLGWVSAKTLPPPPETSDPSDLIRRSQRSYGRIESDLAETTKQSGNTPAAQTDEAPIGRRRRQR